MRASPERRAIVVGSGIAGLSAALHLGDCTVITKSFLGAGSTRLAQGGLAVPIGPGDSIAEHVADTVRVSGGLGDRSVAEQVVSGSIPGIEWLSELGAAFDTKDGQLQLGREAGHSMHRIVHANGDATGAEVIRALTAAVLERPDITVLEDTFALDAVIEAGRVAGLAVVDAAGNSSVLAAPAVVLATGGIGNVYSATTNPSDATGDGLAIAWRAGADVRDCEFVQFHPTALANGHDPLPLLTEALRGAGGHLVNGAGERFMTHVHDDAELAPRDIVARAIWKQLTTDRVYLDARHVPDVVTRFPTAASSASEIGLDIATDLLPVTPAQHYFMGGVAVDAAGRTTIDGLYAVGEVSSSGLHGANRLASNSLIEGLVFGDVVADSVINSAYMARRSSTVVRSDAEPPRSSAEGLCAPAAPLPPEVELLREAMWSLGGIVRTADGLDRAAECLASWRETLAEHPVARNLATSAALILDAASRRTESRGGHYREDFPTIDPTQRQSVRTRRDIAPSAVSV